MVLLRSRSVTKNSFKSPETCLSKLSNTVPAHTDSMHDFHVVVKTVHTLSADLFDADKHQATFVIHSSAGREHGRQQQHAARVP